jgi:hypothetical protein
MHVATDRVFARTPAVIRWQPPDEYGEPDTASGTPTALVTRADGTAVTPVTIGIVAGVVELTLTVTQTATVDRLSVVWLLDGVVRGSTTVDVVGRPYVTVAEVRALEPSLSDTAANTDADLRRARDEVEAMVERAANHALSFVPRFDTAVIQYGTYSSRIVLPHYFIRDVQWARSWDSSGTWSTIDISAGVTYDNGYPVLNTGWWPRARVEVGYEHGLEAPDDELKRAIVAAVRRQAKRASSPIDSRAMSTTSPMGETQRFPTPGLGPWITGLPEVDEVLSWYRTRYPVLAVA